MPLTDYARDRFIAPKLSALSTCGARALDLNAKSADAWLPTFILNTTFRFTVAEPQRQLMFTLLRRADGALGEYEAGRQSLMSYFTSRVHEGIQFYSRALLHFEVCLALTYQAWCLVTRLLPSIPRLFEENDGSEFQRLNHLYNIWRHADDRIARGEFAPDSTLPLWIVNDGLAGRDAVLTFDELADMLVSLHRIASNVSSLEAAERTGR